MAQFDSKMRDDNSHQTLNTINFYIIKYNGVKINKHTMHLKVLSKIGQHLTLQRVDFKNYTTRTKCYAHTHTHEIQSSG